ncbi:YidB family protein [Microvirga soli]|uniref:YidB family protein n=1 Tax=Microvirga soli TaxID=1854496 RepID=UPI0028AB7705|nr:YidB family protein [Microvirga soli]
MPGGLGSTLPGGLGGLLGGLLGGAGGGGLGGLFDEFRQNGYGDHVDSWASPGQNRRIAPDELSQALGPDTLDDLEQQTGLPRQQLLSELSEELPDAVDQFTPDGRLPTEQEVSSRWV